MSSNNIAAFVNRDGAGTSIGLPSLHNSGTKRTTPNLGLELLHPYKRVRQQVLTGELGDEKATVEADTTRVSTR